MAGQPFGSGRSPDGREKGSIGKTPLKIAKIKKYLGDLNFYVTVVL